MSSWFYSDIKFNLQDSKKYIHNINSDYACFALWKKSQPYRSQIRSVLTEKFEILLETEITWSEKNFHYNAMRLYEAPILKGIPKEKQKPNHTGKIGDLTFILFVVRDKNPFYTYAKSVSGRIELSNLNIVKAKYKFREWVREDTGTRYAIHSTNNIYEFFYQVPLLLGKKLFNRIINDEIIDCPSITKDLEGANGWKNYKEMFDILNLTCNYMVQRSFEKLPYKNEDKDIDLLTNNLQRFASAIGAEQGRVRKYKGKVYVANEPISLDIRYVGDRYYDDVWQNQMLNKKVLHHNVFVPSKDDYFFSLLFHCKVQKPTVKAKYYNILEDLANELQFNWFSKEALNDNKAMGKLLQGFYKAHNYHYYHPLDQKVYKNKEVIPYLPRLKKV